MNNLSQNLTSLKVKFTLIFIVITIFTYIILQYLANENKQRYLDQNTQIYLRAYNTIYNQYKDLSDVIFTGLLKLGDVKNKLNGIENKDKQTQAKIREELYKKTIQRYNSLKLKHIKSVNFILPNNTMFLKVKAPNKFGNKLSDKRIIIKQIHKTKKAIDSYEIGKHGAGFRFAYPIIDKGKYLGTLSITFGAEAITSGIMKQYYVLSNFFIDAKYFTEKTLEKKKKLYKKSHHDEYIYDMRVLKELKKVTRKDIKALKPSKKTTAKIRENAQLGIPKSLYDPSIKMIFTSIPIKHAITNKDQAFLTVRSKGETLSMIDKNHNLITLLIIALIATITYVIYQQNTKILKENASLEENIEKDKQLLEQAKMAQMGEMIGNIAHQWRQPLSTITTAASGVKVNHEFNILKEEEIPEFMDTIIKNAEYLSETIDNFRDFIKEENVEREIVIQDKIEKTLNIISSSLANNYIKVINTIHYEEPLKVKMIQGVLSQVLMNILNNAKDIMVEKNIENRWVKLELETLEDNFIISIEDNGGGIPDDILGKIFDPYFTTKHKSQGTGLGLFMSKEIMKKHLNGDIKVQNTKNGAKFYIEVPIKNNNKEIDEQLS